MIQALPTIIEILLCWLALGIIGSVVLKPFPNHSQLFFLLSALGSGALLIVSIITFNKPMLLTLPLGLPGFSIHLQWDNLSAFFVFLLSLVTFGISLFASYYFRLVQPRALRLLCLNYHVFLASMVAVFIAGDAYSFMFSWETMTLSCYFLIIGFKQDHDTEHAGFLYFVIAQVGAFAILCCFAVMLNDQFAAAFTTLHQIHLTPFCANVSFLLALIGFGAKAGLVPLHIWLPEAHPAAPSPISALMSGVMLKTAIYGLLRVSFDFLGGQVLWWGTLTLALGLISALLGVILAAMQTDMKRLLAYSSIENIGIIAICLGLSIIFHSYSYDMFAALALCAALFHCINHALFKSLLFLGTGNVLHATGQRNLAKLGGLIQRMPWVSALLLIGILAIAGAPPLNGFVSEWLLLQAFLYFPRIPVPYLTMLIPLAAAIFVFVVGLAAYVMVKFYGIVFLGKPRESDLTQVHDASFSERCGLSWLAGNCIVLGIFPNLLLKPLYAITKNLLGNSTALLSTGQHWLLLTPISAQRASYSPFIFLCVIGLFYLVFYIAIRFIYHAGIRRGPAWACGYPFHSARMQDSAEGFGQPIKHIFAAVLHLRLESPTAWDKDPHYRMHTEDRFWQLFYNPLLALITKCGAVISKLQQGRISHYLLYSFLTLLLLLWWVLLT